MITIYNNYIPFKDFAAINLFGILFVRKYLFTKVSLERIKVMQNHEAIHTEQMKELLFIGFYIWYIIEWLIQLIICRNFKKAYRSIKFEKEARMYEQDFEYIKNHRNRFAFLDL